MARVRKGEIKYKITDNLYIYNNGKADFLVYINITFKDANNIDINRIEEIINSGQHCEFILNMNDVENSVGKLLRPYIETLRRLLPHQSYTVLLYIFLLKLRFYINNIIDTLLEKGLFDQYNKIEKDNNFIYIIVDYLLDKRKTEQTLQKLASMLKENINMFNKLYEIVKEVDYIKEKKFILQHYDKFRMALVGRF